jgi:hypothetical protein
MQPKDFASPQTGAQRQVHQGFHAVALDDIDQAAHVDQFVRQLIRELNGLAGLLPWQLWWAF